MAEIRFGGLARVFHWLIASLILAQFGLANLATSLEGQESAAALTTQLAVWANHKSVGMAVLLLALARLGWRLARGAPPLPAQVPAWQRRGSAAAHWALYGLIFALPISGWVFSSAAAYSVSFFHLFAFPDLVRVDADLEALAGSTHHLLVDLLVIVAGLHVVAAVLHAVVWRDGLVGRMFGWWYLAGGLALAGVLVYGLGFAQLPADSAAATSVVATPTAPAASVTTPGPTLPLWDVDRNASFIEFRGEQAGATFAGRWREFDAQIGFDPDRLAESAALVRIAVDSNDTGDGERDSIMRDADWFAVSVFPEAVFRTESITRDQAGFVANAQLRLRDVELPLSFRFTADQVNGRWVLAGVSRIDRLAYELGRGDWADPAWVGQFVDVEVRLEAVANGD